MRILYLYLFDLIQIYVLTLLVDRWCRHGGTVYEVDVV